MQQEIYFARRPSLENIGWIYSASSFLLLVGVWVFALIMLVAIISLIRILILLRKARHEQHAVYHDMENFYKKQLKMLNGKQFLHSFYQYIKLLVQLGKWKDTYSIMKLLGYDDQTIQYIEHAVMHGNELDYEQEKHIKDILHQHIK